MELLQQLTRRQLDSLQCIRALETEARGASLGAIAGRLHVAPPSALEHVGRLEELGLVVRHRGKTRLTPRGLGCLDEYRRHHRVVEALFGSLGFGAAETCAAAREIDLAISHRTVEKLCRAERHPSACPHGAPIPACRSPDAPGRNGRTSPA